MLEKIFELFGKMLELFGIRPKPPTPPLPNVDFKDKLLQLHNEYRKSNNIAPLSLDPVLDIAAQKHSDWMYANNKLTHNEGNKDPGDRIREEGYRWSTYGENIAEGYDTPESVFQGWIKSSGHRTNIIRSGFRNIGIGVTGKYWTTNFGTKAAFVQFCPEGIVNTGSGTTIIFDELS